VACWRLDIAEDDKAVTLTAELPGVKESDIDVTLVGNQLSIKGEKRSEHDEKKETEGRLVHRMERAYSAFQRTLTIPYEVDPNLGAIQRWCVDDQLAKAAGRGDPRARPQDQYQGHAANSPVRFRVGLTPRLGHQPEKQRPSVAQFPPIAMGMMRRSVGASAEARLLACVRVGRVLSNPPGCLHVKSGRYPISALALLTDAAKGGKAHGGPSCGNGVFFW
jgi:hypothetical protein